MVSRTLAVLMLLAAPLAAAPVPKEKDAGDVHPYKNAKVGDYNEYSVKIGGLPAGIGGPGGGANTDGKLKMAVTAVTEKEVTIQSTMAMLGQEQPSTESKVDLSKPFDIFSTLGAGEQRPTTTKLEDGKEKIKIGDKEYDCTWTTYKMTEPMGMGRGVNQEGEVKIWMAKGVPGMVKMNLTMKGPVAITMDMELTETGNKK